MRCCVFEIMRRRFLALAFILSVLALQIPRLAVAQSAPAITSNLQSQSVVIGSNTTFSITATGQAPLVYRWYFGGTQLFNGGRISGATTNKLGISNIISGDAGNYWVTVSNHHGMVTTDVATLTVLLPPNITNQPQSQTVFARSNAIVSITTSGSAPLTYRWFFNGIIISNVNSSSLNLTNVQFSMAGNYSVVVSNIAGAVTSAVAVITVVSPPSVLLNADIGDGPFGPKIGAAAIGLGANDFWNSLLGTGTVALETANGNATETALSISYGWNNWLLDWARSGDPMLDDYLGGSTPIGGVSISSLPPGTYDVYLYSHDGILQVTSGGVDYGWKTVWSGFPLTTNWLAGQQYVVFPNVSVTNSAQPVFINFQRYVQQNAIISGIQIAAVAPWILQQPSNSYFVVGSNIVLQTLAEATPAPAYQWFFNGSAITNGGRVSGATSSSLVISNAQLPDIGNYFVVVTNFNGARTSVVAAVQVGFPPVFTQNPQSISNVVGTSAEFIASASGDQPISFLWLFNGNSVSGVTTNIVINPVTEANQGNYSVIASNAFGVVTSAVATLTILVPPSIVTQPANQYVPLTRTASFSVTAHGDSPLSYQWKFNGNPVSDGLRVSGSATMTLAIQNVQTNDIGNYTVIVSNAWGSITSSVATLNLAAFRYVNVNNASPVSPYTSWAAAATVIQDAINVAGPGDEIQVTNGVYSQGGALGPYDAGNRISLNKPVTVVSVNGPAVTTIIGYAAPLVNNFGQRCAYVSSGALLAGFTLTQGKVELTTLWLNKIGGGVWCDGGGVVSNCFILGNRAGEMGGGIAYGRAINCVIAGNYGKNYGGGAAFCELINCTIVGNNSTTAGGAYVCTTENSIVVSNTATTGGNYYYGSLSNSCTTPLPVGAGNITNDPAFVDYAAGNYRLQFGSPCIDAGENGFVAGGLDPDGHARVVGASVDMGAFEYQRAPWIFTSPTNQSPIIYSNTALTVVALGDGLLNYRWQKNGVDLVDNGRVTGSDAAMLSIAPVNASDAGAYQAFVTNSLGSATSAVATLTILGPPIISVQPVSRTVPAGTNLSFGVTASGLAALSYQWRFNGGELFTKTNSSLSLTNVQSANAGNYDVVITNVYGAVTSTVATLTVLSAPPTISLQPTSRVASVGQNISLTVVAKGTEPMTCQWQFNGTDLQGATNFSLSLPNVNSSVAGSYRAAISNSIGYAFSTNVTLTVSPVITWGTYNIQYVGNGAIPPSATNVMAIAASKATDLGAASYAIRADGTLVTWGGVVAIPPGTTNVVAISAGGQGQRGENNLALLGDGTVIYWNGTGKPSLSAAITNGNNVAVAAGGNHQLVLRDDGTVFAWGSNTSGQTNIPPGATNIIAIAAGGSHSLALRADGKVFGWGLNTSGQAGALSNALGVVAISAGGNQTLALSADGTVGGRIVTSTPTVAVFYGPPIGNISNKIAIAAGANHSLALGADRTINGWGTTDFGVLNIPSYASNVLAIAAGAYHSMALVRDPFAPPIPPRIGRWPLNRTIVAGQASVFNALAVGGLPLNYQWLREGAPIPGQARASLIFSNALLSDAGNYQLVVTNDFGAVTSAVVAVTVIPPQPLLNSSWNGTATFNFPTVSGAVYIVQFKTNLSDQTWQELFRQNGTGVPISVNDTNPLSVNRFYRVRVE
jgi:hypothetical protein